MALRALLFLACFGAIQTKLMRLSCEDIRQLVDGHNSRRLSLAKGQVPGQPAATDMKLLVWDAELAAKAAKWASKNQFQHNPDKTIASGRFKTGENLYMYQTSDASGELDQDAALKSWWDEYQDYSYKKMDNNDFSGQVAVGHYTQMAWADSTHVGCGISQFKKGNWNTFLVVCNYGPAGNFLGQEPYPSGRAAGKLTCKGNCSQRYGNKC